MLFDHSFPAKRPPPLGKDSSCARFRPAAYHLFGIFCLICLLCRLLYQEQPSDVTQAVREGVRFLDGGEQPRETGGRRLYSFDQDGADIYSAILQTHGIDLQTVKMHWWKFRMLFLDLHEDTTFQRMISLRSRREKGLLTKEEKRLWLDMAELLELREADPERDRARTEFEQRMRG